MTSRRRSSKLGSSGYRLKNGDVLRVGDYQIVVALENETATEIVQLDSAAGAVPTSIHALHTIGRAAQTDIGAMLDLEELLVPEAGTDSGNFQPVNAYGQAVAGSRRAPIWLPAPAPVRGAERRLPRPAHRAARESSRPRLRDGSSAPAALRRAIRPAGLLPRRRYRRRSSCRPEAQTRLLHLAGQLLREALVGLKDLERSRGETRDRFRIELPPPEPDDPRPSLGRATVDELLVQVLVQHESRSIDAVQWLREAVGEDQDPRAGGGAGDAQRFRRIPRPARSGGARSALRARRAARQGTLRRQSSVLGAVHDLLPQSDRDAGRSPATYVRRGVRGGVSGSCKEE